RVDDAALRGLGRLRPAVLADVGRRRPGLAREVGADGRPALAAVGGLPDLVRAEVERPRVGGGEEDRLGADDAVAGAPQDLRRYVLGLARPAVVARDLAPVDDVGVQRV